MSSFSDDMIYLVMVDLREREWWRMRKREVVVFPRRKPIGGLGHWDCMRDFVVLGIWDSMCSDPLGSLCFCHFHTLHYITITPSFFIFYFYFYFYLILHSTPPHHPIYYLFSILPFFFILIVCIIIIGIRTTISCTKLLYGALTLYN